MDPTAIFTIGLVIGIAGLIMAAITGAMLLVARHRTELASRLVAAEGHLHDLLLEERRTAHGTPYWVIHCHFDYTVNGRKLSGRRIGLEFNSHTSRDRAIGMIGDRTTGNRVNVWYDPLHPSTAVLDKTPPTGLALFRGLAVGGLVALLVGGAAAIASFGAAFATHAGQAI